MGSPPDMPEVQYDVLLDDADPWIPNMSRRERQQNLSRLHRVETRKGVF